MAHAVANYRKERMMRTHTVEEHLKRTSMLWVLVTLLLSVWMLAIYTSTAGTYAHLLFGAALGVLAVLWYRRKPL